MKTRYRKSGFTLIELLVAVALAAILMSMAVPAFNNFIKDTRITADGNSLVSDVNLARSEAIKRGVRVALCSSATPNAATPSCAGSGTWSTGWIVFEDADADQDFDTGNGDVLLKAGQGSSANVDIIGNLNAVQYRSDGTITGSTVARFAVCDDRGAASGSQLQINVIGRPRTISDSNMDCSNPTEL